MAQILPQDEFPARTHAGAALPHVLGDDYMVKHCSRATPFSCSVECAGATVSPGGRRGRAFPARSGALGSRA